MARAGTCESKKNKKKFDPVRPRPKRVVLTLNLHSATHVRLRLYSADCTQHSTMSCPSHIQHLSPSCVALFSNLCKMDMRRLLEKKCRKSFDPIQSLLSPSPLFVFIFFSRDGALFCPMHIVQTHGCPCSRCDALKIWKMLGAIPLTQMAQRGLVSSVGPLTFPRSFRFLDRRLRSALPTYPNITYREVHTTRPYTGRFAYLIYVRLRNPCKGNNSSSIIMSEYPLLLKV